MEIDFKDISDYNLIIDIREPFYFNRFNIKGSINIPKFILLQSPSTYLEYNKNYYILCSSGIKSYECVKILNALGYHCYSIKGGINNIKNKM